VDRDANAGSQRDWLALKFQRSRHSFYHPPRSFHCSLRLRSISLHDDEFIATYARNSVARADHGEESFGCLDKNAVPGSMAQAVVYVLEMVEVESEDRNLLVIPLRMGERLREPVIQQHTVG
jgi:hypothetical protein